MKIVLTPVRPEPFDKLRTGLSKGRSWFDEPFVRVFLTLSEVKGKNPCLFIRGDSSVAEFTLSEAEGLTTNGSKQGDDFSLHPLCRGIEGHGTSLV